MIPIYVINLLSSRKRRDSMIRQLTMLNLRFSILSAVHGGAINDDYIDRFYSSKESLRLHGRDLTRNEIGCAMSHLEVYEKMIASKQECAIILEDDVYIGKMFEAFVKALPSFMGLDWEMINLRSEQHSKPFGDPVFDIYRMSKFAGAANGAFAYAIKYSGAKRLYDYAMPIRFAADGLTGRFNETGLKLVGLVPHIVDLQDVSSDIGWR